MSIHYRPYQVECVQAIFKYFAENTDPTKNPVAALPTGTGKSLCIALFAEWTLKSWPTERIMVATHVKELVKQNTAAMRAAWPAAPCGIYSAGLKSKETQAPILFAGVQSIVNVAEDIPKISILIIDECHLLAPEDTGRYKVLIEALRKKNPHLRVVGFSATPYRMGLGMITDGGIFTDICYDITGMTAFNKLLDDLYLSPLIPMSTDVQIDTTGLHVRGGDFKSDELHNRVVRYELTKAALEEAKRALYDREHWLIFAVDIEHVEMINGILNDELGVSCLPVHSKIGKARDGNIEAFKQGKVRALVNADILTTGFDFPALDGMILLRPTQSIVLHVQILGRGTRPFWTPGFDINTLEGRQASLAASPKKNCRVLDFAGNTLRLGPINDPRIPRKKGEGGGDVPIKVCKSCGAMHHISAKICDNCGAEFPIEEKITRIASTAALIVRDEPVVETYDVTRVTYAPHHKPGFPTSLKVSYYCGLQRYTEWVCLEHKGPIQSKAHAWWTKRSVWPPPPGVTEAMMAVDQLRVPKKIRVWLNKKYPEVLSHIFEEDLNHA